MTITDQTCDSIKYKKENKMGRMINFKKTIKANKNEK